MPVNSTIKNIFSKSRFLESGNPTVTLNESEIYGVLILICHDLDWPFEKIGLNKPINLIPNKNYYHIPLDWFSFHKNPPTLLQLQESLAIGIQIDSDFGLYFLNVCSLHKRRLKFQKILAYQPKPTMDQVGPRGLLEYGICDNDLLNNWLIWRKWIFDIDNRSGQETGYMFEPILASCLGGEPVGSRNSPVKRIGLDGNPLKKARQIDCYIGAENLAYEFKIRVTIAASGQGRFGEELSFPRECKAAGITPVLIVLDPTHSSRLTELSKEFIKNGGFSYIGEDAWNHLEEKSGEIMSHFVDSYIKPPLDTINNFETDSLSTIQISWNNDELKIIGNSEYIIKREN